MMAKVDKTVKKGQKKDRAKMGDVLSHNTVMETPHGENLKNGA